MSTLKKQRQPIETLFDAVEGSPEARDYAAPGYVEVDLFTGILWRKTTPIEINTGWEQLFSLSTLIDLITFNSISELRADDSLSHGKPVIVWGQNAALDRLGGGIFRYNKNSTTADDNVSVIKPNSIAAASPGRYEQFL